MPESDLDLLIDAAREAGRIARRYFRRDPGIWHKPGDAGPVTEADIAVNDMLKAELCTARPDYGWLSEETPDDAARLDASRAFIVDPIDGTRAFIDGDTSFAHSLAIASGGAVTAAVVYLPMKDALYAASAEGPSTLNGQPIRASGRSVAEGATLLATKPNLSSEHWRGGAPPPFERKFRASIAWRLCLVAEGRFDAMLTLRPTWEWDVAAGDLIARRAGARVTNRLGNAIRYNAPDPKAAGVIAAPGPLWQSLRNGLAE
ncbi:Inositol-1-monophosphatase [Defluviimonas aquaemixtae]|uniref:Inositol-1-monophosphatase n=1 Tax=Albidovulum aquaemixtae TaxID=1542388 RepID=A0A2R8BKA0_9RHOB|nr:3'(2'),5'-bisphosphate nucleotidase CysQ [Defluviimonas aquaemixtae]SPH23819.1 Inositol-1-monophosphatase [Defluviimonas aquaemixtae]